MYHTLFGIRRDSTSNTLNTVASVDFFISWSDEELNLETEVSESRYLWNMSESEIKNIWPDYKNKCSFGALRLRCRYNMISTHVLHSEFELSRDDITTLIGASKYDKDIEQKILESEIQL